MSTFKTGLFAIVITIATLFFASLTFAKDPPKSPGQPRPKPGHGPSLTNEQVANPQLLSGAKELGSSGGITITHGGNPPRTGGGFTVTHGGNPPRSPGSDNFCHEPCHRHYCDRGDTFCCEETFEPVQNACVVRPGDTFETISLREYRTSANSRYIASFNRLPMSAVLVPGQRLMLPAISADKVLSASPEPDAASLQVATQN